MAGKAWGSVKAWWKRHGHVPSVLAGSLLGAVAGALTSKVVLAGYGFSALALGPFLVFLGSGVGGVAAASASGRKRHHWGILAGVLGTALLLTGLSLMATFPGASTTDQHQEVWQEYLGATIGVASLAGFVASLWGTRRDPAYEPLQDREAARASAKATTVPVAAGPERAREAAEDALRKARELIERPTHDTETLIVSVNGALKRLETAAHEEPFLASEAKRMHALLRSASAKELLERAMKSLKSAEAGQKAGRASAAYKAALRAEETARAVLAIVDTEREEPMVLRANQCMQAARMLVSRGNRPNALEEELALLERQAVALRQEAERKGGVAPGADDGLLAKLGALQTLCKVTGRADLEAKAQELTDELRRFTASTSAPGGAVGGEDVEQVIPQLSEGLRIVKELRSGGFGRVFLCQDPAVGRLVVVKTLQQKWLDSPSVRKSFKREAKAEGSFQHEGVPRVFFYKEIGGRPFKVMEYVSGGSLRDQLDDWHQAGYNGDPAKSARIVREVVDVLLDFQRHNPGGVHRDLKPENILLDERGRAKLTDFGLAHVPQLVGEAQGKAIPGGTVWYMSPEHARGETDLKPSSDVFALGVILHELFTGKFPYPVRERTRTEFLTFVKRGEITVLEADIPECARALVRACLQEDPAKRPTLEALREGLRAVERQLQHQNMEKTTWRSDGLDSQSFHSLSLESAAREPEVRALAEEPA